MVHITEEIIKQFQTMMEEIDEPLKITYQNIHQGYPAATLRRFLKARDGNVSKAHKMLTECLNWRVQNEIDNILAMSIFPRTNCHRNNGYQSPIESQKPIIPSDLYRAIRDSQLVGMSGYSTEGLPVISIGAGLSTFDKASIHYYVQSHIQMNEYRDRVLLPAATKKYGRHVSTCIKVFDMTGLKLSALNQIKLLTVITSIDDLNYPEKTETYFIVNTPYIFSACWKVVKPLLHERTRKKVQVLSGCGKNELLKIMDYVSLPHFCKRDCSSSDKHHAGGRNDNCFSLDHYFHQQLYNYIKEQANIQRSDALLKQGSFHVKFPDSDDAKIAESIESTLQILGGQNGRSSSFHNVIADGQRLDEKQNQQLV